MTSPFTHLGGAPRGAPQGALYAEPETLLEVAVDAPRRAGDHVEYRVVLASNLPQFPHSCERWHRYSEFVALREAIRAECPQAQIPQLPPKGLFPRELSPREVDERARGLDLFMKAVVGHPLVNTRCGSLLRFVGPQQ